MIHVLAYESHELREYKVLNASRSIEKLKHQVYKRIKRDATRSDVINCDLKYMERKRGNKITIITFFLDKDDNMKLSWADAEHLAAEIYTILTFKG